MLFGCVAASARACCRNGCRVWWLHAEEYDLCYAHLLANPTDAVPADELWIVFAGYVRDAVICYLLARSRSYVPTAGRCVTRDPAG